MTQDIYSMTGSSSKVYVGDVADFSIDITTVNSRYLECYFKLPDALKHLESKLRILVQSHLKRGKLDCLISFKENNTQSLQLQTAYLHKLKQSLDTITAMFPSSSLNALELLNYPGVLGQDEKFQEHLDELILAKFELGLQEVLNTRRLEGEKLVKALHAKLDLMEVQLDLIHKQLSELVSLERERLVRKLKDLALNLDPQRLEQEVVMAAQKSDIAEEYDRLRAHIADTKTILQQGGQCGKKLDFLMQEFNREANTMASKASTLEITQIAVELKVLIEQTREQVQNLE
ncbi:MAG: YicC family protein [Succinivibrio sp.]|nr:YicC family protein [Succinivibrio sp.]